VSLLLMSIAAGNLMTLPVLETGSLKPTFKAEMNEGGSAAVELRVTVSPAGVPIHCSRGFVNGPTANADALCTMIQAQARYAPARDALGRPAYGAIYLWNHWKHGRWTGNELPSWDPVDLALGTNKMPGKFAEGSIFRLILQADASGAVESCMVTTERVPAQVADLLCREAATAPATAATDDHGAAVPSVQEFNVRLTSQSLVDNLVKRLRRQ